MLWHMLPKLMKKAYLFVCLLEKSYGFGYPLITRSRVELLAGKKPKSRLYESEHRHSEERTSQV